MSDERFEDDLVETWKQEKTRVPEDAAEPRRAELLALAEQMMCAFPPPTLAGGWLLDCRHPAQTGWQAAGPEGFTIGRSRNADLTLEEPVVSGRHCALHFDGEDWIAEDLGSKNGVLVNGVRRDVAIVKAGDILDIAGHLFLFHTCSQAE